MSKHMPAGGLKSRQVVEKPVRTGAGAKAISQRFVSRIGASQGNKVTEQSGTLNIDRPGPYKGTGFQSVKFGNEVALNVGGGGPGSGRQIFRSASQHGLRSSPKSRPSGTFD
jgi:hypothetical protein